MVDVLTVKCERCRVGVTCGAPAARRWIAAHVGVAENLLDPLEHLAPGAVFRVEHPEHEVEARAPTRAEQARNFLPGLEPGLETRRGEH